MHHVVTWQDATQTAIPETSAAPVAPNVLLCLPQVDQRRLPTGNHRQLPDTGLWALPGPVR